MSVSSYCGQWMPRISAGRSYLIGFFGSGGGVASAWRRISWNRLASSLSWSAGRSEWKPIQLERFTCWTVPLAVSSPPGGPVPFDNTNVTDATYWGRETFCGEEVAMERLRKAESPDQRHQRLQRDAKIKRDQAAANEAAVDRMIRRNIEEFGP